MPTDSEIAETLRDARSLLERGWCHYAEAEDKEGRAVEPYDERAIKWCALGALRAATGSNLETVVDHPAYDELVNILGHRSLNGFNDRQDTVEPILELFDKAITVVSSRMSGG